MKRTSASDAEPKSERTGSLGQHGKGGPTLSSVAAMLGSLASERAQAQLHAAGGGTDIQRFLAQHQQQQPPPPPQLYPALSNLPALLIQQRQQQQQLQQLQQGSLQFADAGSGSTSGLDSSQLFKQQDQQLLATLMLLRQRSFDETLGRQSSVRPLIAEQLRSSPGMGILQQLLGGANDLQNLLSAPNQEQRATGPMTEAQIMDQMNAVAADTFSDKARNDRQKDGVETNVSKPDGDSKIVDETEGDKVDEVDDDDPCTDTFPFKLFRMLDEAEKKGDDDIVSFLPNGLGFAIHKPREFVTEIMRKYFTTCRMSSFQRQLNLYGFRRITEGENKGGYFHQHFQKGRKGLCKKIKRKKTKVKAPPNFFPGPVPGAQLGPSVSVRQLIADGHMRNNVITGLPPQIGGDLQHVLAAAQLAEQLRQQQQTEWLRQLLLRDQQEKMMLGEKKRRGLE